MNIRTYSTLPASHPMAIPSDKHYSKKETVRSQRKNIFDKPLSFLHDGHPLRFVLRLCMLLSQQLLRQNRLLQGNSGKSPDSNHIANTALLDTVNCSPVHKKNPLFPASKSASALAFQTWNFYLQSNLLPMDTIFAGIN